MATDERIVIKLEADISDLKQQLSEMKESITKSTKNTDITKLATSFTAVATGAKIAISNIKKVGQALASCVNDYTKVERLNTRLVATWENVGSQTGKTADEILNLADAIEKQTMFEAESVQAAAQTLASTQALSEDGFEKALKLSVDLAEAMGSDVPQAADILSRALINPEEGLTRLKTIGIAFTDAEKEQIQELQESGKTYEAQELILSKVAEKYEGLAVSVGKTDAGKLQQIGNLFGDIKENLGGSILDNITPVLDSVHESLKKISKWSSEAKKESSLKRSLKEGNANQFTDDDLKTAREKYQKEFDRLTNNGNDSSYVQAEEYDQYITLIDKEIKKREQLATIKENERKREEAYRERDKDLIVRQEEQKRYNSEVGTANYNVKQFLTANGVEDEAGTITKVKEQAEALQAELQRLNLDKTEEGKQKFEELARVIEKCTQDLADLAEPDAITAFLDVNGIRDEKKEIEDLRKEAQLLSNSLEASDAINTTKGQEQFRALQEVIKNCNEELNSMSISGNLNILGADVETTFQDMAQTVNEYASAFGSSFSNLFDSIAGYADQYYQNQIDNLQSELDARLEADDISQEEEKEMLQQIDSAKKAQFEAEKKNNIVQALINGATGITAIWAQWGGLPAVAAALTAVEAAAVGVQVATISSQHYTGYEHGGIVGGTGITGDNHMIMANAGELILTKAQQASIANQLQNNGKSNAINIVFNGNVFGDQKTISEYVYNGIRMAQSNGELQAW